MFRVIEQSCASKYGQKFGAAGEAAQTKLLAAAAKDRWMAWLVSDEAEEVQMMPVSKAKAEPELDKASTAASTADADSVDGSVQDSELPPEFTVENTFITVQRAPAAKRSGSCPPRIRTPITLMLRNLPNRAKQARIEQHLTALGCPPAGLYVPVDGRTGVNRGYCFVRFLDEATAHKFRTVVSGTQLPGTTAHCTKRLEAVFATNQGAPLRPRFAAPTPK